MATLTNNLDLSIHGEETLSDNLNLNIKGSSPSQQISCPALDPTASIQISDDLIKIYQDRIDSLINQLGKNVFLIFDPIIEPCTNCWTSGAIIYTVEGPKEIQDIECGEYVFTPKGNICKVQGKLQSLYSGRLFNIKCYGINAPEQMTADHKLPIVRNLKAHYKQKQWQDKDYILNDPKIELVEAKDIKIGDALVLPNTVIDNKNLESLEIEGFGKINFSDDLLEFLGWFLAEGCVHKSKNMRQFCFCLRASKEEYIADKLIRICKDIFNIDGKKTFRKNADNLLVDFCSVKLTKFLLKFGHLAENKHIPSFLWTKLSQRQLSVLFKAYCNGDGCVYNRADNSIYNQHSCSTTSKILAFQLFYYLTNQNMMPSILYRSQRTDKNNVNHRKWWEIKWLPTRKEQKSGVRKSNVGNLSVVYEIKEIIDTIFVYNIDIENDHQYIVNGLASENCTFDIVGKRSTGIYKIGGPIPFPRGQKCPYCKARGFLERENAKCIKCLLKWNPKEAFNYGISVQKNDGIVRLKTFLTDAPDLIKAKYAIVNHDIENIFKLKVRLVSGPIPVGLREDRYSISFWEMF